MLPLLEVIEGCIIDTNFHEVKEIAKACNLKYSKKIYFPESGCICGVDEQVACYKAGAF